MNGPDPQTDSMTQEEAARLKRLSEQAAEMTRQIERLSASVGLGVSGLKRRTSRQSKALWLLACSFALDIILTVAIALTGAQVIHNAADLKTVQDITNSGVLCPLYDVFLQSEKTPLRPQPGETTEAFKKRAASTHAAFKVIHQGYDLLECAKHKKVK